MTGVPGGASWSRQSTGPARGAGEKVSGSRLARVPGACPILQLHHLPSSSLNLQTEGAGAKPQEETAVTVIRYGTPPSKFPGWWRSKDSESWLPPPLLVSYSVGIFIRVS